MRAIMSKCADSLEHWKTQSVATRVVETVVAGLLILMMAACNAGPNYKRPATSGGNTSYLEVLTTDTNLYDAQLQLAQRQQQETASLVQLYAALGGGRQ
jgi:hypothetical protein